MVLKTQKWANATFAQVDGYEPCTEDGLTGQETLNSLIEGLQWLLGISPSVPNFGPTTYSELVAFGPISAAINNASIDMLTLLQGALYCKGYDGDALSGTWTDGRTTAGIKSLQEDLGFSSAAATGVVDAKLFKFILNTNPAQEIAGGTSTIRAAQQWLNVTYIDRENFFYGSTSGIYDRPTAQNLIFGIQYALGESDADADGAFGPGTEAQLKADSQSVITVGSSGEWASLFLAAMAFNGCSNPFGDAFTQADSNILKNFQTFSGSTVSGIGDYGTWCALLVSTGDPDRPGTAIDTATTLTADSAAALHGAGYRIVGRYLTNEPVSDLDKKIKPGEIATILGAGLSIFPIFEEGGYGDHDAAIKYYTRAQGQADANTATTAASGYGFPQGTIIYFAVDFDANGDDIAGPVSEYFKGIYEYFNGASPYLAGIYGTRNVCSSICGYNGEGSAASSTPLAVSSFIAGMSTGWSGNLGFLLPPNWAFNQIQEITDFPYGSSTIDIDKDVASGRDPGVSNISVAQTDPNLHYFQYLAWLQNQAHAYNASNNTGYTDDFLVLQYLRQPEFVGATWSAFAGPVDEDFVNYINNSGPKQEYFVIPNWNSSADISHLAGATNTVMFLGTAVSQTQAAACDFPGWAGDLLQNLHYYTQDKAKYATAYDWAVATIGADPIAQPDTAFSRSDLLQDAAGYVMGSTIYNTPATNYADYFQSTFEISGSWDQIYSDFYNLRFGGSQSNAVQAAEDIFFSTNDLFSTFRTQILKGWPPITSYTNDELTQIANGFVFVLVNLAAKEKSSVQA